VRCFALEAFAMAAARTLERTRQHLTWDVAAMSARRAGDRDEHSKPEVERSYGSTPGHLTSYDGQQTFVDQLAIGLLPRFIASHQGQTPLMRS
jgi:hypothetical protein